MGAVTVRDTTADADTVSIYGEGLPVYQTAAACQVALRHAIQKYAGRSHAEGNFGRYLCIDWRTWASENSPAQPPSSSAQAEERCNYSAKENVQHFDLTVRTLHLEKLTTAAELQKLVLHVCVTGLDEREAYKPAFPG